MAHKYMAYKMGIDIGSTTAKVVLPDEGGNLRFSAYQRHKTETLVTLRAILQDALRELGDASTNLFVTGSAGMGSAKNMPCLSSRKWSPLPKW